MSTDEIGIEDGATDGEAISVNRTPPSLPTLQARVQEAREPIALGAAIRTLHESIYRFAKGWSGRPYLLKPGEDVWVSGACDEGITELIAATRALAIAECVELVEGMPTTPMMVTFTIPGYGTSSTLYRIDRGDTLAALARLPEGT